ncbi:MAG: hypothetical protein WKG52_00765 [Variovorax sp.]
MSLVANVPRFIDKKLAVHGRRFDVVRSNSAANPMANMLGSTLAYPYRNPKGHGNADWLVMLNSDTPALPGDYLISPEEVYIYALSSFLQPAQAIRCNHRVALLRPAADPGTGVQGYGGVCISDSSAALGTLDLGGNLVAGWPASILIGGRQATGTHLPMAVANGGFEIMLPKTVPVVLRAGDILLDNLGRRFIADTCELSELGWRMAVKEAHA